ncbi:MAG: hypothetical protein JXA06_13525 [Bacteroidetes bacterium]|nr:hypothetical protein [Bacteroidota bacterium]
MKVFFGLFTALLLSLHGFSCSSGNKETCSEQMEKAETMPEANKMHDDKDTLSSKVLLKTVPAGADTLSGIIYVTGNEPFTQLAIRVSGDASYIVEADSSIKAQLWKLQGRCVNLIGTKKQGLKKININVKKFYTTE